MTTLQELDKKIEDLEKSIKERQGRIIDLEEQIDELERKIYDLRDRLDWENYQLSEAKAQDSEEGRLLSHLKAQRAKLLKERIILYTCSAGVSLAQRGLGCLAWENPYSSYAVPTRISVPKVQAVLYRDRYPAYGKEYRIVPGADVRFEPKEEERIFLYTNYDGIRLMKRGNDFYAWEKPFTIYGNPIKISVPKSQADFSQAIYPLYGKEYRIASGADVREEPEEDRIYAYTCDAGVNLIHEGEAFYAWSEADGIPGEARISFPASQASKEGDDWYVHAGADVRIES